MSTYVISDIHGQLEAFNQILKDADFQFDGSDSLHILGDIVDWGLQSIETLVYIRDLDEKYDFINVYLGNHDLMMYDTLKTTKNLKEISETNWGKRNGGLLTAENFLKLPENEQKNLLKYINNLKVYEDNLVVCGQKYYLSHAFQDSRHIYYKYKGIKKHFVSLRAVAVWHRFEKDDNILDLLGKTSKEKYKNHIFISGHSITYSYFSADKKGRLRIFKDIKNHKICIDCGAKILGKVYNTYKCRLALLRLDDMKEFYVEKEGTFDDFLTEGYNKGWL